MSEPVYVEIAHQEEGKLDFRVVVHRDGEIVSVDDLEEKEPCDINAVYSMILVNVLARNTDFQQYMEKMLFDFYKHLNKESKDESGD